ncbi:putative sensor-like histidine kinase [compost metagenome]
MRDTPDYLIRLIWLNRIWKRWSLTKKLVIVYLPLFVLPSIIGLSILARNYNAAIQANAEAYSDTIANLTVDKLEATIKTYNEMSLHILTSGEVANTLAVPIHNEFEKLELQQQLEKSVLPIIGGLDDKRIIGCVFVTDKSTFIIGEDSQDPLERKDLAEIVKANGATYWAPVNTGSAIDGNIRSFRLARVIKDDNFRPIGTFYLVVSSAIFRDVLSSAMAGTSTSFELVNQQNILLKEPVIQEVPFSETLRLNKTLSFNGWTLTAVYALNTLYETVYRMSVFAAWLAGGCILLGLAASYLIRTDIVLPMGRLLNNMRRGLRGEKPNALLKFKGAREITQLNDTFISVMYEINNLIVEVKKSEERKRQVQLKVLQNQLSPHFMYNTLNSIRWMAMIRKQDHIREMVDALSNLLRYSIRDTEELVTLENEVNIMREFVKIQQVRYQNFIFTIEVDDTVAHYRLLKFLIQPLLENAIVHGLSSINHSGMIHLEARKEKEMLHIRVWDNGSGIEEDRLLQIHQILDSGIGNHIGLLSVKERIENFYGQPYGMEITSLEGAGTTVNLRLPILEEGREQDDKARDC